MPDRATMGAGAVGGAGELGDLRGRRSARRTHDPEENDIIGSVAFSRRGNPATGEFDAAVILKTFGKIPEDFDIA
jgi:hypothetical protein